MDQNRPGVSLIRHQSNNYLDLQMGRDFIDERTFEASPSGLVERAREALKATGSLEKGNRRLMAGPAAPFR